MATIRTKLKQLRDADVRYISLVDRAATRIPFRVLKRDKESTMGIDLTKVFKSEDTGAKPFVSALVVFAQKEDAVNTQIREALTKYGFTTDRVQKSDEGETLVYAQKDQKGETQVVRLSDQMLATVGGLKTPEGWVGAMVEEHGFFPDMQLVATALQDQMAAVAKSETPQQDAQQVLTDYAAYLEQMLVLPANCFKLDEDVRAIVAKCSCEMAEKTESPHKETKLQSDKAKNGILKSGETEEEKKKRAKNHPPSEMAPVDEEDDQKPPPEEVEKADDSKEEDDPILTALQGVTEQLTNLSQKLELVADEQAEQKKVLDDVVQKADTLGTKLSTTVIASPIAEDRPGPSRMRVQKDDDPRTGNFDTAFLRRRRN